jgi:beta-lactamase regulating signal transducer with metallopeptidase domain
MKSVLKVLHIEKQKQNIKMEKLKKQLENKIILVKTTTPLSKPVTKSNPKPLSLLPKALLIKNSFFLQVYNHIQIKKIKALILNTSTL